MTDTKEGFVSVPGGQIYYRIVSAEKSGIPLLVLHGGPGAPHGYLESLSELATDRPVIFYDQLGCGRSSVPDDCSYFTLEHFVDEVGQIRKQLGLDRVHLLGQSWGTMVAAEYAFQHPSGLLSLILANPCLSAERWLEDARAYRELLPESISSVLDLHESRGTTDSAEYQKATQEYYQHHVCRIEPWPDALQRSFDNISLPVYTTLWGPNEFTATGKLRDFDCTDRLPLIKVPTLFLCGRFDGAAPATTQWYQSLVAGAELVVFEESSHMPHLEEPDKFRDVVSKFLVRVDSLYTTLCE